MLKPNLNKLFSISFNEWLNENEDVSEWIEINRYKGSDGGYYIDYALKGNRRNGLLTVEVDSKNGYRVRNIFVSKSMQRQGCAINGYDMLNNLSIKDGGKPLRSSEIGYNKESSVTSLSPESEGVWKKLISIGKARQDGDHYVFI